MLKFVLDKNSDFTHWFFSAGCNTRKQVRGFMLTSHLYPSLAVDLWSVGCIMAELISGRTLFPGADREFCVLIVTNQATSADIDQLTRIMNVCGTPSDEFLARISSEEARNYIRNVPPIPRKDFKSFFSSASPLAIDFLERTLNLDPVMRWEYH